MPAIMLLTDIELLQWAIRLRCAACSTCIAMVWLSLYLHMPYSVVSVFPLESLLGYTALVGRPPRADTSRYSMVVKAFVASQ